MALRSLMAGYLLVAAVVTAPGTAGAGEAGRREPVAASRPSQAPAVTMRVTPSTGLVDDQVVEVEVAGLMGTVIIAQCDPNQVWEEPDGLHVNLVHCRGQEVSADDGVVTTLFTVDEEYDTNYRGEIVHSRCGGFVPDCLMVAVPGGSPGATAAAATTIHFDTPLPDPAVTVTPSSGLRDGDLVQIEVVGLRPESLHVAECEREVAETLSDDITPLFEECLAFGQFSGAPTGPVIVSATVAEAWAWDSPDGTKAAHCGPEPGGCVIVAYGAERDLFATAPIDVEPSQLTVEPGDQEAGFPVHVFVAGRPGATVRVAQCATPVRRTARANRCARSESLTLDETGDGVATLTLVEQITTRRRTVRCTTGGCAVAVFTGQGRTLASSPLTVYAPDGPPVLSVEPHVDLVDNQWVELAITGTRNSRLRIAQCDASVVAAGRLDPARCAEMDTPTLGHDDPQYLSGLAVVRFLPTDDGALVPCYRRPGDCVLAVDTDAGELTYVPLSFAPTPVATLTPASGLLDGQPMSLHVTGLQPGVAYEIERCNGLTPFGDASLCITGEIPPVVASPDGVVTTTVAARQRFTTLDGHEVQCHQQCHVGLFDEPTTLTPYAMADGR